MNFTADSKVLIQGITEPLGATYTTLMKEYGTNIVAGVSPGHRGEQWCGVQVFDMVEQALEVIGPVTLSILFVSPYLVLDAALEAIEAGIRQLLLITEGVPPLDMVHLLRKAEVTETLVVGPNCPGIIVPGQVLLGTHPAEFYNPGAVGLISRSGTLTYEVAYELTAAGLGQSICVGIGSDAIPGSSFSQWLQILDEDEQTEAIVLVGEMGGDGEEAAARYIAEAIDKPVVAYIAGRTIPRDRDLGHAGAILASQLAGVTLDSAATNSFGSVESKIAALKRAKVPVADRPSQISKLVKKALKQ
ncbi:MAG: CoA-binding protein [Leptolyngbyaceae cyanobacterium bins.59]|nr:CoA-binding protein [Leptolyngbyaceae cyanobacterium bins.59]